MQVNIDFETRNASTDIKAGVAKYAKTAEILCLSYSIDGGVVKTWTPRDVDLPLELLHAISQGAVVHAHNASFERAIWREICVKKYGWPEVAKWRCTMARALYSRLPGALEKVAIVLKLGIDKDMDGNRLMKRMTKPRKMRKAEKAKLPEGTILWHETPEQYERLCRYCEQDVRTELAESARVLDLTEREWKVWEYDARVNDRGVRVDTDLAKACIKLWGKHVERLNAELEDVTLGIVKSAGQVTVITKLLETLGHKIGKLNKKSVSRTLKVPNLGPVAKRTLEIRQELSKASVSKFKRILQCVESDSRIRGCFQYHGAGTGRWAGRQVQWQNLPRPTLKTPKEGKAEWYETLISHIKALDLDRVYEYGTIGDVLSSVIRTTLVSDPDCRFLVADFAQIEARCAAWLAGEKWLLEAFTKGECVYRRMGEKIYGVSYDKITDDERQKSKVVVLGAQYGLGPDGLMVQMDNYGIKVDRDFCDKLIKVYRKTSSRIVDLWYSLDRAAVKCVETGVPVGGISGRKDDRIVFHRKGDWLAMRLPSGRDIHYYQPTIVTGKFGNPQVEYFQKYDKKRIVRTSAYGGKWLENASQAICRDVMVEAMSHLERNGYPVSFHVHDEVVAEPKIGHGSLEHMLSLLSIIPKWATGFPIIADGFECTRYRK